MHRKSGNVVFLSTLTRTCLAKKNFDEDFVSKKNKKKNFDEDCT